VRHSELEKISPASLPEEDISNSSTRKATGLPSRLPLTLSGINPKRAGNNIMKDWVCWASVKETGNGAKTDGIPMAHPPWQWLQNLEQLFESKLRGADG
jgi:hypothetical protein